MLTMVHLLYVYVLWFKLKEKHLPDPQMRNVEFAMYVILVVYVYKLVDYCLVVASYTDYEDYIFPQTFIPMGVLVITMQLLLISVTLITFLRRKSTIGRYSFDNFNENLDSWNDQY